MNLGRKLSMRWITKKGWTMQTIRTALALTSAVFMVAESSGAVDPEAVLLDAQAVSGIDLAEHQERLLAGELVTSADGRFEVAEEEIAAIQIMYLPVQVADIAALLVEDNFHSRAHEVQALLSVDDQVHINNVVP